MGYKPKTSPWGEIQHCENIYPEVYFVTTAGHGGIMVEQNTAKILLSDEAIKCGFKENGYVCFEEDTQAAVVEKDLLINGILNIPDKVKDKVAYEDNINKSLMTYNPDYWQYVENKQKDKLFDLLDDNLIESISILKNDSDKRMFFASPPSIASVFEAHKYLKESHYFKYDEISCLLKHDNPLIIITNTWQEQGRALSDMDFTLFKIVDDELIKENKLLKNDKPKAKKISIKKELQKAKESLKQQIVLRNKCKTKER